MADKLCLKVCQNFRHEIAILIKEPDFSDTLLSTYPALCDHPQRVSKLKQTLAGQTEQDCDVVLVGACFAGSTTALPVVENLEISKLNQCIYCFAGQTLAEHYMQEGAYLLTPGWLENWQRQISDWAFDQTTAREFFKESASKLVLLDTGVDKDSAQRLQDLATYLDLPTETIPIGLDHFRLFMQKRVQDWKQDQASRKIKKAITLANQKTADYSMAFDLLANLTSMRTEADVVQGVLGTFRMLFAPNRLIYLPVRNDQLVAPDTNQVSNIELAAMQAWLTESSDEYMWLPNELGFRLRLTFKEKNVALLEVAEMAFPEYRHQYLNLALVMARLSSMAMANARMFQQVQESANTDDLSGLSNRRFFFSTALKEWERAERYSRPLSIIMFDIDYFKQINDTYGHITGDKLITALADRCRRTLRSTDTFSRYGGDEFIVLLPEIASSEAHEVAERLLDDIKMMPFEIDGHSLNITVSLGVASLDNTCTSLDELIHHCDEALYQAKAKGRNQTVIWEP